ncbi:hypothetical protein [Cronobacter sakazakii]|uniref:hypothetical protein n=1 Tax=Cronobacter sakazakii TaxID=28141 RepID=UPI0009BBFAEB|nr:hypothetical protein [Cronobacter sakazakii]PUX69037.1 hypothetical protein BS420_05010 [Cronobacter sakazakii]
MMKNTLSAAGYNQRLRVLEAYYGVELGGFWHHRRFDESRRALMKDKVIALIAADRGANCVGIADVLGGADA